MAGEFEIIKRVREIFPKIGDDAAVFDVGIRHGVSLPIVSTDSFVVGEHFGEYFTPYDIGYKTLAASISDIAACGGTPKYALISIGLKEGDMEFVEKFYRGVKDVAEAYGVEIIGGDTTKSGTIFVNVTVIGEIKRFIGRNGARVGDTICVTGELGGSFAGLLCLRNREKPTFRPLGSERENRLVKLHLNPMPRAKEGVEIAKYANSMIDISDGLIIDLSHILEDSGVWARIWKNKLPISKETARIARKLRLSPQNFAMNGGEDFELLFTIPKKRAEDAKKVVEFTKIGEIIEIKNQKSKIIDENGKDIPIRGFDHFDKVRRV